MRRYPVFVPHEGKHLAALLTVPDAHPEGLVLLLSGGGVSRSYHHSVWSRVGAALATDGFATAAFDCAGTGDSSGRTHRWSMSHPPVAEAEAVLMFATRALGVERFAVVGSCIGGRAALVVASRAESCVGAICLRTPLADPTPVGHLAARIKRMVLVRRLSRAAWVRRHLRRPLGKLERAMSGDVMDSMERFARRRRLLLLYGRDDSFLPPSVESDLRRRRAALPPQVRERVEIRVLPDPDIAGLNSVAVQSEVIETIAAWVRQAFVERPAATPGHAAAAQRS